jgi:heat shock protein HslJ
MCSSFPIILNFGGAPFVEKPIQSEHVTGPLVVANWDDAKPVKQDVHDVWILEEVNDITLEKSGWRNSPATIAFDPRKGTVYGQSPCNGYSAPYKLEEKQFQIGCILATRAYCQNENRLFEGLRKADACVVTETGRLCFLSEGVETLQFRMDTNGPPNGTQP